MLHMKLKITAFITVAMSLAMTGTVFAGTWENGSGENSQRWKYNYGNGTYAQNSWQWIDGNNDGIAECYYFDADGWMLSDTITSDGYQVNENGAWVKDNNVQTKSLSNEQHTNITNASDGTYYLYKTDVYDYETQAQLLKGKETDSASSLQEFYDWGKSRKFILSASWDQQVDQLTIKNTSDAGADIQPAGVDSRVAEHVREKHYEHIGDQYIYTSPYNSDYHEYIRFFDNNTLEVRHKMTILVSSGPKIVFAYFDVVQYFRK